MNNKCIPTKKSPSPIITNKSNYYTSARPYLTRLSYASSLVLILVTMVSFSPVAEADPVLNFDVSNSTPTVGETFTVDVNVDMVDDLFIYNLDLDVGFDSSILEVQTVEAGPFLSSGGFTLSDFGVFNPDTSTPGSILDINDSLLGPVPGVSGSGTLATITFNTLSTDQTTLNFLNLNQGAGTEFANSQGNQILITNASSAVINGTAVIPEPSEYALLSVAFVMLIFARAKMKSISKSRQAA